jgi:hypothetical protein
MNLYHSATYPTVIVTGIFRVPPYFRALSAIL